MQVYRAEPRAEIIREGEGGDFMLMVLGGALKCTSATAGTRRSSSPQSTLRTLGEMSMIDGQPRFATCLAVEATTIAVLDRESLARIIVEQPLLGAKVLMELVLMLSQRLRATSERLLGLIDDQTHSTINVLYSLREC